MNSPLESDRMARLIAVLDSDKKSHVRDAAHAVLRSAFNHLFYRRGKPDDADGLAMCTLLVASSNVYGQC